MNRLWVVREGDRCCCLCEEDGHPRWSFNEIRQEQLSLARKTCTRKVPGARGRVSVQQIVLKRSAESVVIESIRANQPLQLKENS